MREKLIVVLFFVSAVSQAQEYRPGYIIKVNGDSLMGYVRNGTPAKNSKVCYFKSARGKKKEVFDPYQLKAYGILNYRHYESKPIPNRKGSQEKVFAELLVKGAANLFKYNSLFYFDKDSVTLLPPPIEKKIEIDGTSYLKPDLQYKGFLNRVMSNCGLKADNTRYEERALTNLIQNYNKCLGRSPIVYKIRKPWTRINPSLFGVFDRATENLDGLESYAIRQSISIPIGIGLDVSSPRINDKTFFSLELWYVKKNFQGYSESTASASTTRTDLYLYPAFIKIPVGIRFNFLNENNTPYVKAGFSQYFLTSVNGMAIAETESNGIVTTDKYAVAVDKKNQTGVWVGAGYSKRINHIFNVFTEIRFEKNNGFVNPSVDSSSSGNVFNILFGLKF